MEGLNPLDWTVGPFLFLYTVLAVGAPALSRLWRDRLPPHRMPSDGMLNEGGLDVFSLAYLAGGKERMLDTALVGLFEAGAATLDRARGLMTVDRNAPVAPELMPFRHAGWGPMRRS